jgi:hypothetical protein
VIPRRAQRGGKRKAARAEWRVKRVGVGPHAHQEMLKESQTNLTALG